MSDHLPAGQAERFLRGELNREETKDLLRHLARGCEACCGRLFPLLSLLLAPEKPGAVEEEKDGELAEGGNWRYDEPLARALASVLSLRSQPAGPVRERVEGGLALIRGNPRGIHGLGDEQAWGLRGAPLVEILLRLSFEERYRHPAEMLRLALLAKTAAENLAPVDHDPLLLADLQARALAELGNARRVNDQLPQAEAAFDQAEERLRQGSCNLLLLARLADLRASLLSAQRRLPDARALLGQVYALYRKVGDDHLAGRALMSQAICANYEGYPREALGLLRQAGELLDRERDPELAVAARESELEILVQCGRYREAGERLLGSGLRQDLADAPLSLAKLRCVEGRILAGLGKSRRAEAAFLDARAQFISHKQGYNAAIVGLDLAAVWLELGQNDEVSTLASELLDTFRSLGIQREALRALEYFNAACRARQGTPKLARRVVEFLKQLEREPQLRFEAL